MNFLAVSLAISPIPINPTTFFSNPGDLHSTLKLFSFPLKLLNFLSIWFNLRLTEIANPKVISATAFELHPGWFVTTIERRLQISRGIESIPTPVEAQVFLAFFPNPRIPLFLRESERRSEGFLNSLLTVPSNYSESISSLYILFWQFPCGNDWTICEFEPIVRIPSPFRISSLRFYHVKVFSS